MIRKISHWRWGFRMTGVLAVVTACAGALAQTTAPTAEQLEFFESKIRPVLAANCWECHGPDKQKADLRLDHFSTMFVETNRGIIVDPGNLETSVLAEAISYENVDFQMPPDGKLDPQEIADLRRWIEMGAPWPDEPPPSSALVIEEFDLEQRKESHWAWQPVQAQSPPEVEQTEWPRDPIDRFVLAKLEAEGLAPAPDADPYKLLRRVYFDLTGLPPTVEEIRSYVEDDSPDALSKVVDRLLASPRFGERWARHWLDLVRYAETYGHEQDYPILHAWKYRDYVIRALNADVPIDQFVTEHIAGDLLDDPRIHPDEGYNESVIGTGFWFMHQATHAPVDVAADEADRIDNQIDVMGKAFMGMTLACARCHDHKFDAVSTADYYALSAFMRKSRQQFALLDPHGEIAKRAQELGALQADGQTRFAKAAQDVANGPAQEIAEYLRAGREVLHGEAGESSLLEEEVVFDDFERDSWEMWTVEGDAFGADPSAGPRNKQRARGYKGDRFANSYGDGNYTRGRALSRPFMIKQNYIRLLVGGGNDPEKTVVNLSINGNTVRSTTGQNDHILRPVVWDVSEFVGEAARIELVDDHTGDWGHIMADQIVQSPHDFPIPIRRPVESVARAYSVDTERLTNWVMALDNDTLERDHHPLYAWKILSDPFNDDLRDRAAQLTDQLAQRRAESADRMAEWTLYEDFDGGSYGDWFVTGEAFGDGPVQGTQWIAADGSFSAAQNGVAHSGVISNKLEGVLRSPTFTVAGDNFHFRVAGNGGKVRLIIRRYQLRDYNALLFDDTIFDVHSGDEFVWRTQRRSIGKFKGQKAYIEIIDPGDGFIAVDEIWFSNDPEPQNPFDVSNPEWLPSSETGPVESLDALAERIETSAVASLEKLGRDRLNKDEVELVEWLLQHDLVTTETWRATIADLSHRKREIEDRTPRPYHVLAAMEGTPEQAYVFVRGNHKNLGEPVEPEFIDALDELAPESGLNRLDLAQAVASPDNPLTARVFVNRLWHHLFGRGIVASPDNFGVLGERPSHPELLDYLAQQFVEQGWSIKETIRTLMNTRAYRMAGAMTDPVAEERDPANILLHRANVRRLEGEAIRDSILYVAGVLDETMYGPSVPIYLSPFMSYHRRPGQSGPMDGDRRRTIYVEVRRNFLSPMMLAFDGPIPDTTRGARTNSNIPAQALILMNDPFVLEQAKTWGARIAAEVETPERVVDELFLSAIGRPVTEDERQRFLKFIDAQGALYGLAEAEATKDERIWADLCHVLFTLKEFVFLG